MIQRRSSGYHTISRQTPGPQNPSRRNERQEKPKQPTKFIAKMLNRVFTRRATPFLASNRVTRCARNISSRYFSSETREFQAETRKLLDIVTNSIYTDKEVFLRELISNSSDALEKYRYKQVLNEVKSIDGDSAPLGITITADKEKGVITIIDNGIGMTKDELIGNLGTIT